MTRRADYTFHLYPHRPGHDHVSFRVGTGHGFIGNREPRSVGLDHCPDCSRENYAMAVLDGKCAWCGFDVAPYIPNPLPPAPVEAK